MQRLSVLALVALLAVPASTLAESGRSPSRICIASGRRRFRRVARREDLIYVVSTTDLPRATRTAKLWMSDTDGGNARQITFGSGNESAPSFSPDGKWIGFVSTRDGGAQLYVMPTAGGRPEKSRRSRRVSRRPPGVRTRTR